MLTSMVFGLLTNEAYSLEDTCYCKLLAQYVYAIRLYRLRCNIFNIENQLLFAYRGMAPNFKFL